MPLSDLKFMAAQCLNTLVLNKPETKLVEYNSSARQVKLRKEVALDIVKASYDLAELMLLEGDKRDAIKGVYVSKHLIPKEKILSKVKCRTCSKLASFCDCKKEDRVLDIII